MKDMQDTQIMRAYHSLPTALQKLLNNRLFLYEKSKFHHSFILVNSGLQYPS